MSKLKISTRLMLLVAWLAICLPLIAWLGLYSLQDANRRMRSIYVDRLVATAQLGHVNEQLMLNRLAFNAVAREASPDALRGALDSTHQMNEVLGREWTAYRASQFTPEELALAQEFERAMEAYRNGALAALMEMARGDGKDKSDRMSELLTRSYRADFLPMEKLLERLTGIQMTVAGEEVAESERRYGVMLTAFILASAAALLTAGGYATWVARGLGRQLGAEPHQAAAVAERIAAGDLAATVTLRAGDGVSLMAQMSRMQQQLRNLVGEVRRNAESVATASAQISQGNTDLSHRTEQTASALEQTSAAIAQILDGARGNADNASRASQMATEAATVAHQGRDAVQRVVQTMREIESGAQQVAEITGLIESIAFQTNILALNAAVEAARAGDQGRGFAVVASEVRSLAGRAAEAAKQIKALINTSVSRVAQGSQLADRAGATMSELHAVITRVNDLVAGIAADSREQMGSVSQVNDAVAHMDQTTQQNAALVEESAAAAESLRQQAGTLVQAVATLRTEGGQA